MTPFVLSNYNLTLEHLFRKSPNNLHKVMFRFKVKEDVFHQKLSCFLSSLIRSTSLIL
jgi:hypothetical protein